MKRSQLVDIIAKHLKDEWNVQISSELVADEVISLCQEHGMVPTHKDLILHRDVKGWEKESNG